MLAFTRDCTVLLVVVVVVVLVLDLGAREGRTITTTIDDFVIQHPLGCGRSPRCGLRVSPHADYQILVTICRSTSNRLPAKCSVDGPKKTSDGQYIRYVEMVYKQTIWNYQKEDAVPFLKIATVWPQHVTTAKNILENVSLVRCSQLGSCCRTTHTASTNQTLAAAGAGAQW